MAYMHSMPECSYHVTADMGDQNLHTFASLSYTLATRMPMRRLRQATSPATSAVLMRCFTMAAAQPYSTLHEQEQLAQADVLCGLAAVGLYFTRKAKQQ